MPEGEPSGFSQEVHHEAQVEEEGKEPTLEEQAAIYAEIFGVDAAQILERARSVQAEMSEDERRKMTMLVYTPEKFDTAKAWELVKRENMAHSWYDSRPIKGETEKATIAFAHFSQEPDEDSLGEQARSALEWEKTDQKFMSPKLRMIAGELFKRINNGEQLDENNITMCPRTRLDRWVPELFNANHRVQFRDGAIESSHPLRGVRKIVSKEF